MGPCSIHVSLAHEAAREINHLLSLIDQVAATSVEQI